LWLPTGQNQQEARGHIGHIPGKEIMIKMVDSDMKKQVEVIQWNMHPEKCYISKYWDSGIPKIEVWYRPKEHCQEARTPYHGHVACQEERFQ
jgi:hypothetical protein